jgi:integrase
VGPRLKLPRYVHGFLDRHGKPRFYFRRPGFETVPLPGLPYTPEFMRAYEGALAGQPRPRQTAARPGTMAALALSYFGSPQFGALRPTSQYAYRRAIERFCKDHGDRRAADLRRDHIVKLMSRLVGKPQAANALRRMLRNLMRHAIDIGIRGDDPTRDVKAIRTKTGGHHSWTDDEIAQFERCHAIGSRARLALALLLYSGQRRGDVIRMGPQHVRDGILRVKQEKTGAELAIPVHPELAAVIAATPSGHLTFLATRIGGPFAATTFTHWFRRECDRAGLAHCSAHGLRKAAARRLAEAGCTAHEIGAITGHTSLAELVRYTKAADQRRLAETAMAKTRTSTRKPAGRFAKKGEKVLEIKRRK